MVPDSLPARGPCLVTETPLRSAPQTPDVSVPLPPAPFREPGKYGKKDFSIQNNVVVHNTWKLELVKMVLNLLS